MWSPAHGVGVTVILILLASMLS
jgi:Lipocalin-like domain